MTHRFTSNNNFGIENSTNQRSKGTHVSIVDPKQVGKSSMLHNDDIIPSNIK